MDNQSLEDKEAKTVLFEILEKIEKVSIDENLAATKQSLLNCLDLEFPISNNELVPEENVLPRCEISLPVTKDFTVEETFDSQIKDDLINKEENQELLESSQEVQREDVRLQVSSKKPPKLIAKSHLEVSNFFKGVKWSPDGLSMITNADDATLRLFTIPQDCFDLEKMANLSDQLNLDLCLKVKEPEIIYDYCWFPLMNSNDPETCCFVTSAKDQPVHLWSSIDGSLKASYLKFNSTQEIKSAYSLAINSEATQLLCGFNKEVSLFYLDRPGSQCENWATSKKKNGNKNQQNGIISCCAFSPDDSMFVCGCYNGTAVVYDSSNGKPLDYAAGCRYGLSHVQWSKDGYRFYAGARRDNFWACWDIRYLQAPLFEMNRCVDTNQRIYFDIMPHDERFMENMLATGHTDGHVTFWSLDEFLDNDNYLAGKESSKFRAHDDCVNGCSFNPCMPLLATTSGQRSIPQIDDADDDEVAAKRVCRRSDNSLKIWLLPLC